MIAVIDDTDAPGFVGETCFALALDIPAGTRIRWRNCRALGTTRVGYVRGARWGMLVVDMNGYERLVKPDDVMEEG